MRTFNVFLTAHWNFAKKIWEFEAMAEPQDSKAVGERCQLLFTVPENWIPETKEDFLNACTYFKQEVPSNIIWFGYVPF